MIGKIKLGWLRGVDLNHRPLGYEPNELPDCSTPRIDHNNRTQMRQTALAKMLAVNPAFRHRAPAQGFSRVANPGELQILTL